jgi:hypothetical protein
VYSTLNCSSSPLLSFLKVAIGTCLDMGTFRLRLVADAGANIGYITYNASDTLCVSGFNDAMAQQQCKIAWSGRGVFVREAVFDLVVFNDTSCAGLLANFSSSNTAAGCMTFESSAVKVQTRYTQTSLLFAYFGSNTCDLAQQNVLPYQLLPFDACRVLPDGNSLLAHAVGAPPVVPATTYIRKLYYSGPNCNETVVAEDTNVCPLGVCSPACVPVNCSVVGSTGVKTVCGVFGPSVLPHTRVSYFSEGTCSLGVSTRSYDHSLCISTNALSPWTSGVLKERRAAGLPGTFFRIVCDSLGTYLLFHSSSSCDDLVPLCSSDYSMKNVPDNETCTQSNTIGFSNYMFRNCPVVPTVLPNTCRSVVSLERHFTSSDCSSASLVANYRSYQPDGPCNPIACEVLFFLLVCWFVLFFLSCCSLDVSCERCVVSIFGLQLSRCAIHKLHVCGISLVFKRSDLQHYSRCHVFVCTAYLYSLLHIKRLFDGEQCCRHKQRHAVRDHRLHRRSLVH